MKQNPANFSLIGFLKLTRTSNLIIVAFTQIFAAYFILGLPTDELLTLNFVMLVFSTGSIAAAGYVINDYYDIKIDMVNKPGRVVIGTKLKRRSAMGLHFLLNIVAFVMGYLIKPEIALIHLTSAILLWWYSNDLKRRPFWGNFIVALLTAATVLIVGVFSNQMTWLLWLYSGFAFFFTLWREIIKDMEDRFGDEEFGCKTLPIIWGLRKTKKFVIGLMTGFTLILLSLNYPFENKGKLIYLMIVILSEIILAVQLLRADKVAEFRNVSTLNKAIIILGILSMVFSRVLI